MHGLDQSAYMLGRRKLRYPVAKIKHMAGARAVRSQHLGHLLANLCRLREQGHRIEIALQCNFSAYSCAGIADIARPIESYSVTTNCGDILQP